MTISRIDNCFAQLRQENKKALIPYIAAGDPSVESTVPLLHAMVDAGADIIELGIPFSDPSADGPTIQLAAERALKNGMTLTKVLAQVTEFRQKNTHTPIVLMGYANPIEAMGISKFVAAANAAQVDGVLVVDYPPEECAEFKNQLKAVGIAQIFLLAPTSSQARSKQVGELGAGYIYYVSRKGVTGAGSLDIQEVTQKVDSLRAITGHPICVGFGIRDAESAKKIAAVADGVVIGSRIIEEVLAAAPNERIDRVRGFLAEIRHVLDM